MNVLTTEGYKPIEQIDSSDNLVAYSRYSGEKIINHLISKDKWTHSGRFDNIYDNNGNLVKTSEEIYDEIYGPWKFIKINNKWILYHLINIWANNRVVHVKDLVVGDTIYDENDDNIIVTTLEDTTADYWWRLKITGDHSYIADGLALHNPTKYWVGGGSSTAWNATGNTNWSDTSGGPNNASVPLATDDAIFNGSGSNANSPVRLTANTTITALTFTSAYSSSFTHSLSNNITLFVAGNLTLSPNMTYIAGGTGQTIQFPSASVIASNGTAVPTAVLLQTSATSKTLSGSDFRVLGQTTFNNINGIWLLTSSATPERWITNGLQVSTNMGTGSNVEIVVTGGGGWTGGATFYGNLTLSGSVNHGGNTTLWSTNLLGISNAVFRIVAGSAITSSATIFMNASPGTTSIDMNNNFISAISPFVNTTADVRYHLSSSLRCGTWDAGSNRIAFVGPAGFIINSYRNVATAGTTSFTPGNVYRVTGSLNMGTTLTSGRSLYSSTVSGARATFIVDQGATVLASNYRFRDIDASGGRTINVLSSDSIINCLNIRSFTDLPPFAFSRIG